MPKVIGLPKVRFNLDIRGKEEAYINMLFRFNGKALKMGTGQTVRPENWDGKAGRAKMSKRAVSDHIKINSVLDSLAACTIEVYRQNPEISVQDLKDTVLYRMGWAPAPIDPNIKTVPPLFDFAENILLPEKKMQPRGTWKVIQTGLNLLKQYAQEYKAGRLDYSDINFSFFADFKRWLYAAPRRHTINYAAKMVNILKQIMRDAQRRGYHNNNDYLNFSIKKVKATQLALSFEQLETLYQMDLSNDTRLERVRDLFLIGAYTGLRYSDFTRIRPENFEQENGEYILTIVTQKTGEKVSIPIWPIPLTLLKKYDFRPPRISNQKMNEYLKELGQLAGMKDQIIVISYEGGKRQESTVAKWEMLSTHVARRSFATNFYREGIPASKLMKITGHATERQFMDYIAIDAKTNALDLAALKKR